MVEQRCIGVVDSTVAGLIDKRQHEVKLPNGQNGVGTVNFRQFELVERPSFVDYLRSGWQISLTLALDFTASNGNPSDRNSLHFLGTTNQYEAAISQVGQILEAYDQSKQFPVFGFGGIPRMMGLNSVSHCFPLNGQPTNPAIPGIGGILGTYKQNLPSIGLGGPTLFAPILEQFMLHTKNNAQFMKYQILLIITDGIINDMRETIAKIVAVSSLPCSIIIVGVGNADFSNMEQLDGDDGKLMDDYRNVASRDIVQFVRFLDCQRMGNLAQEVLMEVPE